MRATARERTHIFICYVDDDIALARALTAALRARGLRTWFDEADLVPGDLWQDVTLDALDAAAIMVVLVTDAWDIDGGWYAPEQVTRGLNMARDKRLRVIPVLSTNTRARSLPYGLQRVHGIEALDDGWAHVARQVQRAVQHDERLGVYLSPEVGRLPGRDPRTAAAAPVEPQPSREAAEADGAIEAPARRSTAGGQEEVAIQRVRRHMATTHASLRPVFQSMAPLAAIDEVFVPVDLFRLGTREVVDETRALIDLLRGGRWALLGDPGAGKSTLARYLTWSCAMATSGPLALYLSLADWSEAAVDPFDFVAADIARIDAPGAAGVADALRRRAGVPLGVWLILDGLDEVGPGKLAAVRRNVEALAERWPHAVVVVCSRPIGYRPLPGFEPLHLLALDRRRQRRLLARWLGDDAGQEAFERIDACFALDGVAGSPLLLALMAQLARGADTEALPSTRGELYGRAIDLLLARCEARPKSDLGHFVRTARRALALLSLHLTAAGGESWTLDELDDSLTDCCRGEAVGRKIHRYWPSTEACLGALARGAGILGPHDGGAGRWRYLHRSFRERLAAEALAGGGADAITARAREVADSPASLGRWGETLGMACALTDDPVAPLMALEAADPGLALRILPELTGLPLTSALDLLWRVEPRVTSGMHAWDGDTLLALVGRVPVDEAIARLTERVDPRLDLDRLAFVHYALTRLGRPPRSADFFSAAGRSTEQVPPIAAVEVGGGMFRMGEGEARIRVSLSVPFSMGCTPVTRGQYAAFDRDVDGFDADKPVTWVSWWRARLFAAWVGGMLPTEAQWEYACRNPSDPDREWSCGDASDAVGPYAWYRDNSGGRARPVATRRPNPRGLHDMHGNVWEWCYDYFAPLAESSRPGSAVADPAGPDRGRDRVLKGGSFASDVRNTRTARRGMSRPGNLSREIGFRVAWVRRAR